MSLDYGAAVEQEKRNRKIRQKWEDERYEEQLRKERENWERQDARYRGGQYSSYRDVPLCRDCGREIRSSVPAGPDADECSDCRRDRLAFEAGEEDRLAKEAYRAGSYDRDRGSRYNEDLDLNRVVTLGKVTSGHQRSRSRVGYDSRDDMGYRHGDDSYYSGYDRYDSYDRQDRGRTGRDVYRGHRVSDRVKVNSRGPTNDKVEVVDVIEVPKVRKRVVWMKKEVPERYIEKHVITKRVPADAYYEDDIVVNDLDDYRSIRRPHSRVIGESRSQSRLHQPTFSSRQHERYPSSRSSSSTHLGGPTLVSQSSNTRAHYATTYKHDYARPRNTGYTEYSGMSTSRYY